LELEEFGEFVAEAERRAHDGGAARGNAVSAGARDFGDVGVSEAVDGEVALKDHPVEAAQRAGGQFLMLWLRRRAGGPRPR
jgi:hypothetical protein